MSFVFVTLSLHNAKVWILIVDRLRRLDDAILNFDHCVVDYTRTGFRWTLVGFLISALASLTMVLLAI